MMLMGMNQNKKRRRKELYCTTITNIIAGPKGVCIHVYYYDTE